MKKTTTRNVQYCWVSILDYYSTLLTSNSTSTYYLPILSEAYFSTIHSAPSIYYGVSRPADRLPCTRQFSLVHLPTSYLLYTSSSFLSADFCTSQVESVEVSCFKFTSCPSKIKHLLNISFLYMKICNRSQKIVNMSAKMEKKQPFDFFIRLVNSSVVTVDKKL